MRNRLLGWNAAVALVLAIGLVACGGGEGEAEPMEEAPAASAASMEDRSSSMPSVSFVTPMDGATVSSPVAMEFIVSNLNISPVPAEVEMPREGMGASSCGYRYRVPAGRRGDSQGRSVGALR